MEKSEMEIVSRYMQSAPVDMEAIFSALGVGFEKAWMDSASGSISRNGDRFIVSVNALESDNRQRFTAAHELAHYLFHRDLMGDGERMHRHVDNLYNGGQTSGDVIFKREHEVQANRVAAQIIMPKALVEKKFAENADAGALAFDFGVSKAAMEIRLKTLGLS
jgi:Zn-dependent peptidase ImmA (M78 family)